MTEATGSMQPNVLTKRRMSEMTEAPKRIWIPHGDVLYVRAESLVDVTASGSCWRRQR